MDNKKLFLIFASVLTLFATVSFAYAEGFEDFSGRTGNVVIVVGDRSAEEDRIAADLLLRNIVDGERDARYVSIVSPNNINIANSTNADLIVIGGPCVNSFAAKMLNVSYPTCGSSFENKVEIGSQQYIVYTNRRANLNLINSTSAGSSNRLAILIAGYDGEDTIRAANFISTNPSTIQFLSGVRFDSVAGTNLVNSESMNL